MTPRYARIRREIAFWRIISANWEPWEDEAFDLYLPTLPSLYPERNPS